jgi:drug/metabolite transporter (DMT)-like permease
MPLAIALAIASALAFAVATVAQQRAAAESSDQDARGGQFFGQLLRNPRWLAATAATGGGYVLQAIALGVGSVIVVQPILVTALLFALPLSAYLAHQRLHWTAAVSGLLLGVSLAVFLTLANPNSGADHASAQSWLIVAAVGVPAVATCLIVANRLSGARRASLLAIATGLLGGVLAVLTKAVVASAGDGVMHLLTSGETYGLLVVGLSGIYVQQLAFQAGALQASLPIMTVLEPVVASVLGLALLHEELQASGLRLTTLIIAALVMTVATVALAREQAQAASAKRT